MTRPSGTVFDFLYEANPDFLICFLLVFVLTSNLLFYDIDWEYVNDFPVYNGSFSWSYLL